MIDWNMMNFIIIVFKLDIFINYEDIKGAVALISATAFFYINNIDTRTFVRYNLNIEFGNK